MRAAYERKRCAKVRDVYNEHIAEDLRRRDERIRRRDERRKRIVQRNMERGATLRVILDPNRDAFGREKNGIPNRQAAWDLHEAGIPVRWCATEGADAGEIFLEQCGKLNLLARCVPQTPRPPHDATLHRVHSSMPLVY